ncbi:unnamed protein product [Lactuca virosa]|uniref:Uncharacterized protein n=1 Tax=Lactuca virosa TaxID=75947 RepID=A0AAU9PMM7_9ASTR|nr:unnamed protein product [Lactuca virosa]
MSMPDTPVMPHTPLTPHGSASRDISGDHGSNAGDFDDSSLPIIHKEGDKFGDHSIHSAVVDLFWQKKWQKLSDAAQTNRNTPDSNGKTSRHTAGSIGYAEHRRRLKAHLGKDPEFCDLYVKTHGTSESKKRYFEGERENIEYCSETAKDAKDAYLEGLVMKYGEDPANHRHDAEVWVESQIRRTGGKKKGLIYGIGASDANFVVSGITSSESTRLCEEVSNMRQLQEQMVQQMERMAMMMNGTTNQANDPPHTPPHTPPEDGV